MIKRGAGEAKKCEGKKCERCSKAKLAMMAEKIEARRVNLKAKLAKLIASSDSSSGMAMKTAEVEEKLDQLNKREAKFIIRMNKMKSGDEKKSKRAGKKAKKGDKNASRKAKLTMMADKISNIRKDLQMKLAKAKEASDTSEDMTKKIAKWEARVEKLKIREAKVLKRATMIGTNMNKKNKECKKGKCCKGKGCKSSSEAAKVMKCANMQKEIVALSKIETTSEADIEFRSKLNMKFQKMCARKVEEVLLI